VLAAGAGRAAVESALAAARPALQPIDTSAGFHAPRTARHALLAQHVDLSPWLPPARARRLSWPSRHAVAAAEMAIADAGLDRAALPAANAAVVLATAFGTARYAEQMVRDILVQGPEAASPFLFSESVANAPAAQVALALNAPGANVAVAQREAGPLQAVGFAARELRHGRSRIAFAGCCEEINPLVHALLGRFRALALPTAGGCEVARPFDRRRSGFLAAEGATVLVLEREADAAARGARPLARLLAWERGFDATAPSHGWGAGAASLAERLLAGLRRQGVDPASIDRVVSGASGAAGGDRLEAGILRHLFGVRLPPVQHAGGHLVAAVLAAAGAPAWPTAGFAEPDPDLGIVPHDGSPLPPARRVLASALASGGAAAWLVLEAVDPPEA
jgi:3-oxoacyl-[acyl-carrier-protein] synthase II